MLTSITIATCVLTSFLVAADAHRNKIPNGKQPYSAMTPVYWLLGCLALWIVVFPTYLFRRAKTIKARNEASGASTAISLVGGLAVVAMLLCLAAPFLGWERLSDNDLRDQVGKSIQSYWQNNPATQNIRLKSLTLVHQNGNEYSGFVVSDVSGKEERHVVDVTCDGKSFMWKIH